VGRRQTFAVETWVRARPAVVHELVADGSTWPAWTPIGSFRLERQGDDGGESPGAIRVFRTGVAASREQIVEVRPDQGISYVVLSGLPIRNHRADVELTRRDGGTAIVWREAFDPKMPGSGWPLRAFLQFFIGRCARGLVKQAARRAAPVPVPQGSTTDSPLADG
jgi:Polyketide cyclase / dehydrase and lipid transport